MDVQISLAAWPGLRHLDAAGLAIQSSRAGGLSEPAFGSIACAQVQVVPQSFGQLTESVAAQLRDRYPEVRFRLHANVRVLPQHRLADLSCFDAHAEWFGEAARLSRLLDAPAYTAHAGRRTEATLATVFDNTRRCADLFGVRCGVEGHYPTAGDEFLLADWREYRALLDAQIDYALDLSHLNIVAHRTGRRDDALVADLLASEHLLELHISSNDGRGDQHRICDRAEWWTPLLAYANPAAVVFTEGNHRRRDAPVNAPVGERRPAPDSPDSFAS